MTKAKTKFKYTLKFAKQHENVSRKESLAKKISNKKPDDFWKEIRSMKNVNVSPPNNIEGISGSNHITELWKNHYNELFNCINDNVNNFDCNTVYSADNYLCIRP